MPSACLLLLFAALLPGQLVFKLQGEASDIGNPELVFPINFETGQNGEMIVLDQKNEHYLLHWKKPDTSWQRLMGRGIGPEEAMAVFDFIWNKNKGELLILAKAQLNKVFTFALAESGCWELKTEKNVRSVYNGFHISKGMNGNWIIGGIGSSMTDDRNPFEQFSLFLTDSDFNFLQGLFRLSETISQVHPAKKGTQEDWMGLFMVFQGGFQQFQTREKVFQAWSRSTKVMWYEPKSGKQDFFHLNGPHHKPIEYEPEMKKARLESKAAFNQRYGPRIRSFSKNLLLGGSADHLLLLYSCEEKDQFTTIVEGVVSGNTGKLIGNGRLTLAQTEHGKLSYDGERRLLYHLYEDLEKEGRWLLQTYRLSWPGMSKN